jgi:xanthine dehydrogenase accessory factor
MQRELLDLAAKLARAGEPFALATVVARTPPISAQVGDVALVTRAGGFHGWVGGSCTRPTVIAEALRAIDDGRPRLVALDPNPNGPDGPDGPRRPGLTVFPMTCHSGGRVEIHIQPVLPPLHLIVYGLSPTARALVRLGKAMGYTVDVVDPDADAADFPDANAVLSDPRAAGVSGAGAALATYAVVATQGQWDEEATAAALALRPRYLGVMASAKRFSEIRAFLSDKAQEPELAGIKNPAGLDLGAQLPEEIALSILAEIVEKRRAEQPRTSPADSAPAQAPSEERDPVCGMMVVVVGAAHRAQHDGRTYFFCCGGCKQRFLATPERYVSPPTTGGGSPATAPLTEGARETGAGVKLGVKR